MNEFDDPFSDWDAAYVLGALSSDERKEYEHHLANCTNCSRAVAGFAGVPGILSKIDIQTAMELLNESPQISTNISWNQSGFIQKLASRAERDRIHSRVIRSIGVAAAALILISIGVTSGEVLHHSSNRNSITSSQTLGRLIPVTNLQPQIMTATFRVTSKAWGTRIDWNCTYPNSISSDYSSSKYNLVITDTSGHKRIIATWQASSTRAVGLAATSDLSTSQIKYVEVTIAGSTAPLVRGEI